MAVPRQRIRLPQTAWRSALTCLLRGDLWDGPDVAQFEKAFAEHIGAPDAVAVPSGRAGFRSLFEAFDLPVDAEVICSAFAYPVVPYLLRSLGYKVRFVDCEMRTLGLDPERLAATITDSTRAVVATHLYGVPCRIEEVADITASRGVMLVEDCAHCFGASIGNRKIATFGEAGCFSFETSKIINTMGGGMVTVRDPALGERVRKAGRREPRNGIPWLARRLLKTSFEAAVTNPMLFNAGVYPGLRWAAGRQNGAGQFASGYRGDEITMAGRMGRYTNYQAGLGLKQLRNAAELHARRIDNAERLMSKLRHHIRFQEPAGPHVTPDYMLVTALVPRLRELSAALLRAGIDSKHLYMRDCSRLFGDGAEFPNAARAERETLHLPAHAQLSARQIDAIAAEVAAVVDRLDLAPAPQTQ